MSQSNTEETPEELERIAQELNAVAQEMLQASMLEEEVDGIAHFKPITSDTKIIGAVGMEGLASDVATEVEGLKKDAMARLEGTVYGSLPQRHQPLSPPPWQEILNPNARAAVERIYNGNFMVRWKLLYARPRLGLKIVVSSPSEDDPHYGDGETQLFEVVLAGWASQSGEGYTALTHAFDSTTLSPEFGASISIDLKTEISHVVLHHFLQQCGALLPGSLPECLMQQLKQFYSETKRHRSNLMHAFVAYVDICIVAKESDDSVAKRMNSVANCLQQMKQHQQAADLWKEIANSYTSDNGIRSKYYVEAFFSLQKILDYQGAEFALIHALYCAYQAFPDLWSASPEDIGNHAINEYIVTLLPSLYMYWYQSAKNEEEKILAGLMMMTLPGLLNIAQVHSAAILQGVLAAPIQIKRRYYKKPFVTKKGARQALAYAIQTPSVNDFREAILDTLKHRNATIEAVQKTGIDTIVQMKIGKVEYNNRPTYSSVHCCYSSCDKKEGFSGRKFAECPCHAVAYCSPTCQRAHWPEHKKVCAWKKTQMASSSGGNKKTSDDAEKAK